MIELIVQNDRENCLIDGPYREIAYVLLLQARPSNLFEIDYDTQVFVESFKIDVDNVVIVASVGDDRRTFNLKMGENT